MKRYLIIVLISIVSVTMLSANKIVKTHGGNSNYEIKKGGDNVLIVSPSYRYNNRGTADTLQYVPADGSWNAYFVQFPGDAMFTAFQMPANATIKAINVPIYLWGTGDQQLTLSLHKLSYPYDADGEMYPSSAVDGAGWIGGYDMDADGHMSIEGTTYSSGGTQGVCDDGDFVVAGAQDPLGTEVAASGPPGTPKMGLLWPLGFTAATMDPTNHPDIDNDDNDANWTLLSDYGNEIDVLQGDWVGVMVAFTGEGGGDDDATGFLYESGSGVVDPWVSAKFYAGCGGTSGNGGWHIRSWMFNFQLAVELTSDRGPVFTSVTKLPTTISTAARPVTVSLTEDNPIGGDAGVASVVLSYQVDSLTATVETVPMTMTSGTVLDGTWEADIPGPVVGSFVYWSVTSTDVNDNATSLATRSYYVFEATPGLPLVFNNQALSGIEDYLDWTASYDVWESEYGGLSDELLGHYDVVLEMAGLGPDHNSDDEIEAWWGGGKTYIVSADEWLYSRYGSTGVVPIPSVAHDVLGIASYVGDINYGESGDDNEVSRFTAVTGDAVGGALATFLSDSSLYLNYDPDYETGGYNWLDGIVPIDGYTVALNAFAGVLDSVDQANPDTTEYAVAIYGQQGNGGKSAFLAFDHVALNTAPDYFWVGAPYYNNWLDANYPGIYVSGPLPTVLVNPLLASIAWAEGVVGTGNEVSIPIRFELKGNYPNPFNPTTSIVYVIDTKADISITVYNMLGQQIANLFNGNVTPGSHEVKWNGIDNSGHSVASGVYFYRVEAVGQTLTGKMMLLK
ncbi:MAG: T9SS type A sorting domain-containing protein [Candidatus Marinimicrobia bacterium]|nr:T9SS type A sorting domain-containing protein [Candidatus Neomarinimicrobiota bacterium]